MNRASYTDEITSIQALHTLTCLSSIIMYCTVGCLVPYDIEVFGHNIEHVTAISPMKRQVRETAGRRQVHRALPRPGRNLLDALSTLLQQQLDQICWDPARGDLSGSLCGWHVRPHACWERGRMSWFLWCGWDSKLPWSLVLWLQSNINKLSATCPFLIPFLGVSYILVPFFPRGFTKSTGHRSLSPWHRRFGASWNPGWSVVQDRKGCRKPQLRKNLDR